MTYLDELLTRLKRFEGCILWMYLDSVGKVTVGIGLMLPTLESAMSLPFEQSVQSPDIAAEYTRISQMQPNHAPGYYRAARSPVLSMEAAEQLCRGRIAEAETGLRVLYPGYDGLPDPAKIALVDMQYNLGTHGLSRYVQLHAALLAGDLSHAAAESYRHGIQPARNAWTAQQFLLAAKIVSNRRSEQGELKAAVA